MTKYTVVTLDNDLIPQVESFFSESDAEEYAFSAARDKCFEELPVHCEADAWDEYDGMQPVGGYDVPEREHCSVVIYETEE